jgi:hypothetical protein
VHKESTDANSVLLKKMTIEVRVNNTSCSLSSSVLALPSTKAQEKSHQGVNFVDPTAIEKVQSIKVLEEAQKNVGSVNVEKPLSTEARKEKVQNNNCSSSTAMRKMQSMKAPEAVEKNKISVCAEKAPFIEAQTQIVQNTTNGLSSTRIEKIPVNDQNKSSSVYADKTPSTEAQKEKLQINNCSTGIEKLQLIEAPEAQNKLITVCVEKTPCIKTQKEIGQNNTNSLSLTGVDITPIVEQKKSSSVCVDKTPSTNAQREKAEKREKDLRLPCVEKRPLIDVQKVQQKMDDWSSTRFPKIEKMVLPYNIDRNSMVFSFLIVFGQCLQLI